MQSMGQITCEPFFKKNFYNRIQIRKNSKIQTKETPNLDNLSGEIARNPKYKKSINSCFDFLFPKGDEDDTRVTEKDHRKTELYCNFIRNLVSKGGPNPEDYQALHNFYAELYNDIRDGNLNKQQVLRIWDQFGPVLTLESLYGRCLLQDGGIGSYKRISEIHEKRISTNPQLANWDLHYQRGLEAPNAVRERLAVATEEALQEFSHSEKLFCIKDLPSGPGDFGKFFYQRIKDAGMDKDRVDFHCGDLDEESIEYAKQQNPDISADRFRQIDLRKYQFGRLNDWPNEPMADFIYCAGFCDYLSDKRAIKMLNEFYKSLKDGGCAIVGNFNKDFPDKYVLYMHNWFLRDRSKSEMLAIALQAGISKNEISFLNLKNRTTQILMRIRKI